MTDTQTLNERIKRGIAVLDDKLPGWEDRINLDTLDLSCPEFCVVGQANTTSRDYYETLCYLFPGQDVMTQSYRHGFTILDANEYEWEELTATWSDFIDTRRQEKEKQHVSGSN